MKFDPLIGGRPSIMPPKNNTIQEDDNETINNNNDLIAMNSPSPPKQAPRYVYSDNSNCGWVAITSNSSTHRTLL